MSGPFRHEVDVCRRFGFVRAGEPHRRAPRVPRSSKVSAARAAWRKAVYAPVIIRKRMELFTKSDGTGGVRYVDVRRMVRVKEGPATSLKHVLRAQGIRKVRGMWQC